MTLIEKQATIQDRISEIRKMRLGDIADNSHNWRLHPERQRKALSEVYKKVGWAGMPLVYFSEREGKLTFIDGHLRKEETPDLTVRVAVTDLNDAEADILLSTYDPLGRLAEVNVDALAELEKSVGEVKLEDFWPVGELETLLKGLNGNDKVEETEPQIDKAEELQKEYGTALGQIWTLGEHRLAVGDCTDRGVVEAVMGEDSAILLHADPPYGMGKEKDGIANDNLYREKLDAFQLQWWDACRPNLKDNGSVYIWGNAEDLWRLWYVGGLKDRERLTFRNQIVWDKGSGQGMLSSDFRMYAPATEHCFFFMLGEQGFNYNYEMYFDEWDSIRLYLNSERKKMQWGYKYINVEIYGTTEKGGGLSPHHFQKSQWAFLTKEHYAQLQLAAQGQAFKRDYDELKRDFCATRAYFDNTHDNMTDVWQFSRVIGEDRWGHATPKPVAMFERVVKSSSLGGAVVLSPFLGSGPDLIACENLKRKCRGIEIDPGYAAVSIHRWESHTGQKAELIEG